MVKLKALWQLRRDCAHLVACYLGDESIVFDVFYGVNDSDRQWLDIDHARDVLGYDPTDSGDVWTALPGE